LVFKIEIEECLVVLDGKVTIVEVGFIKICKNLGIKLFLIYKENHCAISDQIMPMERREKLLCPIIFFSIIYAIASVILLICFTLKYQLIIVIIHLRNNFQSIFKKKNRRLLDLY